MEAGFRSTRRTLLDRGMIYVIAHVRGGGEMGRQWYEEPNGAKYLCKKNTFNDFVDVAKWLIDDRKLTTPEQLSCEGRSAGGLLIGQSINQAPDLFKMALLGVPFVDVVCTMIDASIPLTVVEWEEWGVSCILLFSHVSVISYTRTSMCMCSCVFLRMYVLTDNSISTFPLESRLMSQYLFLNTNRILTRRSIISI